MTENQRKDAWDMICGVDADKLDLLYELGNEEVRTQMQSRLSIRGRCQTLLILLVSGVAAAGRVADRLGSPSKIWMHPFPYLDDRVKAEKLAFL